MNPRPAPPRFLALALCALVLLPAWPAPGAGRAGDYLKQPDTWFAGPEAQRIATHLLSWQAKDGGWPKNTRTTERPATAKEQAAARPTFDNGATTGELRFLARHVQATGDAASRAAFERGYDYILRAQYPNGGWPQSHPPGNGYPRHITFNDDAMVRLLQFLRESATAPAYAFLDADRRAKARRAFDLGIQCILQCQIRVDGRRTAWCAQHDERDFSPRPARAYELASLSGSESAGIVRLLMSLEPPSPEVIEAVEGAVTWFRAAALKGIRVVEVKDPAAPGGRDRRVVSDPDAPPLWARFYELGSNRPLFCDRDGVPKRALADIGHERRNGYAWLGSWPDDLLNRDYPAWKKRRGR